MTALRTWVAGARVRTLPAALAPVLVGTGAAAWVDSANGLRAALAAGVALLLQVGVNYANDYSDGVRGTDTDRVGPVRLVASGLAPARTVKRAAWACFAAAAVLGSLLSVLAGAWWLIGVGAICVIAAWFYTGGSSPYGYAGLGEVAVLVFFGLVATYGTVFTQAGWVPGPAVVGGIGVGLLCCAILMANNIRDIPTDAPAGKRTLAVRLGDRRARIAYTAMVLGGIGAGALAGAWEPWAWLVGLSALAAVAPIRRVMRGARGPELIAVLRDTGFLVLAFGVGLGAILALA